jgi:phosphohistidine phosphatase
VQYFWDLKFVLVLSPYLCLYLSFCMSTKTIIFIRHAKSSWTDLSMKDYDRPLDDRGRKDAPIMAEKLNHEIPYLDKLLASTANRAWTTAAYFAEKMGVKAEGFQDLYHAPPSTYLGHINQLSEEVRTVALVGHNPGMTEIALHIEEGSIYDLPTCGIIIATVSGEVKWDKVDWVDMNLQKILTPKEKNY